MKIILLFVQMINQLKLGFKYENEFIEKIIIENAHEDINNKVIYDLKGNFYSCSFDETIKIWESKNNTLLKVDKY